MQARHQTVVCDPNFAAKRRQFWRGRIQHFAAVGEDAALIEVGGVWIDEGFGEKTPSLTIKYLSDAYFKILEKQPEMKEVYKLGSHWLWITPSGTALIVDTKAGRESLADDEVVKLFQPAK